MQHLIGVFTQWPPTQSQVLLYNFVSMILFLAIALIRCTFAGFFSLPYQLKCIGGGAAFPTLLLISIYPFSPDLQYLFSIEVIKNVAMVGAVFGSLLSLHTLFNGP
jgi:hypothetical protein